MSRNLSKIPQVALLFETNEQAHRDILHGVLRYERIHGPWSLHVAEGRTGEQRLDRRISHRPHAPRTRTTVVA